MNYTLPLVLGLLALGLAAGFLSGLVGIGGGVIIVPALIFLLGFTQHQAQGTSLAVLVLPIGILGAWQYFRSGQMPVGVMPAVATIAVAFVLGSWVGGRTAVAIPDDVLRRIFGGLLLVLGVKFLFFAK